MHHWKWVTLIQYINLSETGKNYKFTYILNCIHLKPRFPTGQLQDTDFHHVINKKDAETRHSTQYIVHT